MSLSGTVLVHFLAEGRGLQVDTDHGWLRCPSAAAGFPPFNKVVETLTPLPDRLTVDAAELATAVKSAAVAMDAKMAHLEVTVGDGRLTVTGIGDTSRASAWVNCGGKAETFVLCGRRTREMTAAIADAVPPAGTVELAVDGKKPDTVGLTGGGVCYIMRAMSTVEE